ncbi:sigma-54 dependent transcriptional regulator [Brevibacillus humidisoli]|uniref:sigma-54-dependent transcriptional regulator n=1 Tax=Brevibacillus humidisoli TaxID=2895522 RepID=UPI001E55D2AC|nr:sigma-54 dependent transcriptional regulator [Brevibacillus humidisoli]UFJ41057.1 sigma-54 dependent transcriptional regulator [Brevibacillus humidisoli]
MQAKNCEVTVSHSGRDVYRLLETRPFPYHLALIDLKLPDANGLDLLPAIKAACPACEVIVMTGYSTIKSAVTAIQSGARDYLEKPFDNLDDLEQAIFSVLDHSHPQHDLITRQAVSYGMIYADDSPMATVMSVADKLAKKAINVLIEGETGTGKELMARFLHGASLRAQAPFIAMNCAAIPETLLESELFGHEKGAFTGAIKGRKGFFELADSGTLFLDEIGEAPATIQAKLLRVMETGEFMRIGGEQTLKGNIRFISATNRNLEREVELGRFRADLLYRLEGVKLTIPALRKRPGDIPLIVNHYLQKKSNDACRIDPAAVQVLQQYDWPGNVRQLLNVVNQAMALHDSPVLRVEHLPAQLLQERRDASPAPSMECPPDAFECFVEQEAARFVHTVTARIGSVDQIDFPRLLERIRRLEGEVGRRVIRQGLAETDGDRALLSDKLGISKRTLRYILNEKE